MSWLLKWAFGKRAVRSGEVRRHHTGTCGAPLVPCTCIDSELAVEIESAEVRAIVQVLRRAERLFGESGLYDRHRHRRQALVKVLFERAGATSVTGHWAVPLFGREIELLEEARNDIESLPRRRALLGGRPDPMLGEADRVTGKLRMLVGQAKAAQELGGVAVFRVDDRPVLRAEPAEPAEPPE